MKIQFKLFLVTLVSIAVTSCSDKDTVKLTAGEEGHDKLKQLVVDQFGGDREVFRINFSALDDLDASIGFITLTYLKDGKLYSQAYNGSLRDEAMRLGEEEINKFNQTEMSIQKSQGKLKLSDLDLTAINKDAELILLELDDDFSEYSIRSYSINVAPKTNELSSVIKIQYTPTEGATSLEGKSIVTNYYEVQAEINATGDITYKEQY
ncbi:hypothetical protein I2486_08970 [Cellulophaga sp. E16_2]|uniref:hypothetical protein n=1 Tax=Cellulophaga sp. E16_2 TaxID=2789297 RepID=UPI001A91CFD8|nr:hypothetical protein [Cellulophaga sp. E16_2]MBO0591539.1 hypothetical protein [Cellulophaga sp. E16_2]